MVVRFYSSVAPETTLSAGITGASTSITVGSVTGFPANTPYTLALDYEGLTEELVQVNAAAGTTLTVVRAVDGTSAASHNAGARVRHVSSARDFADSRSHENTGNGVHGLLPGEVIVGTTSVQTLTNKTLTAPVIDNPTINGNITGSPTIAGGTVTGDSTAKLRLQNTTDAGPASTNHAFQIGLDSAANIRIDNNEIMAINNGAVANIFLNPDGGNIGSFVNQAADSVADTYTVNGNIQTNVLNASRASGLNPIINTKLTADAQQRLSILANGAINWGPGNAGQDVNLFRSAANVLRTDDSLEVGLTATALNLVATNSTTTDTLTVTSGVTFPSTTVPAATLISAAAGWTILGTTAGINKAGHMTVELNIQRSGGNLVVPASGLVPGAPVLMGTIAGAFRPNTALGVLTVHIGNSAGSGTAQITSSTGDVNLYTFQASTTISTGNSLSITATWPLP